MSMTSITQLIQVIFLFADDTNIFVVDKCKIKVFEKANKILKSINDYMKCNLLHINI